MKNLSIKKIVLCSIALIAGVFTIAGPAFGLVSAYGISISGYDLLKNLSKLSGSDVESALSLAATFIMMFAGIVCVILPVVACFVDDNVKSKNMCLATLILGALTSVLYTAAGAVVGESYTVAFVPMIIIVLAIFAYIICAKMMTEKPLNFGTGTKQSAAPAAAKNAVAEEADRIELLTKYKKLLDEGIITQEEFDKKKSQLL